eukprot:TRINITY_DN14697_c0_g1_i3.p2 TRINITY_DN14697_c0_g1~~TRINITY_DN14697_c0_g1_i3.p2  ORF type:complete len:156 (-),score=30.12 TRINITY_DN14697_c0_g1_i3:579-1046(-)
MDLDLARYWLEVFFPMLYFDWMVALTLPDAKTRSWCARFFRLKAMSFLADISLAVFLLHMMVMQAFQWTLSGEHRGAPFWCIPLALPTTVGLGWLLTRYFEEPIAKAIRGDEGGRKRRAMAETDATQLEVVIGAATPKADLVLEQEEPKLEDNTK